MRATASFAGANGFPTSESPSVFWLCGQSKPNRAIFRCRRSSV